MSNACAMTVRRQNDHGPAPPIRGRVVKRPALRNDHPRRRPTVGEWLIIVCVTDRARSVVPLYLCTEPYTDLCNSTRLAGGGILFIFSYLDCSTLVSASVLALVIELVDSGLKDAPPPVHLVDSELWPLRLNLLLWPRDTPLLSRPPDSEVILSWLDVTQLDS